MSDERQYVLCECACRAWREERIPRASGTSEIERKQFEPPVELTSFGQASSASTEKRNGDMAWVTVATPLEDAQQAVPNTARRSTSP
jgi:hypothetical protein